MKYDRPFKMLILAAAMLSLVLHPANAQERPFTSEGIRDLMKKVNTYTVENPYKESDRGWIRSTYYTGVMGAYKATKDPAYLEQALEWAEKHEWKVGTDHQGANKLFASMVWAELNLLDQDPKKIQSTVDFLHADVPNSPACGEIWFGHSHDHRSVIYADSLYATPVFPMLYKATQDRLYLDIMNDFFWYVTDTVFDHEEHLYYRDDLFIGRRTANDRKILWSRGNGWVFASLPRVLEHLPRNEPSYERFVDIYLKMAVSLASRQHEDGFWRSNLADRDEFLMPESSGTSFFTFAFAWGLNKGLLDEETYLPVVIKAWNGLKSAVHPHGNFGWVQPVDALPRPSLPVTTHEYATGLFLLAGSEVLKLAEAGLLSPEIAKRYLVEDDVMLPSSALKEGALKRTDHPLADKINEFMIRQKRAKVFESTPLNRSDYLDVIAGQVIAMQKYQDDEGRIIDPVTDEEMYYTTPCYAHSVAVLASAGYGSSSKLTESGMKALDVSLKDLSAAKARGGHGDFYTWPAMLAYELFKPLASRQRVKNWKKLIGSIDPPKSYRAYVTPYKAHEHKIFYENYGKTGGNWNLVNTAGEFLRAQNGFTGMGYVDFSLTMQLSGFTPYGMYNEHGNPLPYDLFPRHYLAGMLKRGYRSFVYTTYRELLWKGAWTSLFMQSLTGELPVGYRSSQHIWNEAQEAVLFEIYASEYANVGKNAEAGAFKRAARLALTSIKNWIREDGSGYIVKNRFPIEERHGYERYSQHSCYNMLACSMLAQAWQFADDAIEERPSPADLGGFAFETPGFHKLFANAGGTYVEYDTDGDHKYNPTGLIRIHLKDGHPQLGPSNGCAPLLSGEGVNFAVGPAWMDQQGNWTKLADLGETQAKVEVLEEKPGQVKLKVIHLVKSDSADSTPVLLTEFITVRPDEVLMENQIEGAGIEKLRIYYPMLVSDGKNQTDIDVDERSARLQLNGKSVLFQAVGNKGKKLKRTGQKLDHRNGIVDMLYFDVEGTEAKYRITTE